MLFSNSRVFKKGSIRQKGTLQMNMPTIFALKQFAPKPIERPTEVQSSPQNIIPKNMWGPAIWYFFHTIAQKVKEESFILIKKDLISHIRLISSNLPCPNCSVHATQYLNGIDMNKITTKEDLKMMLYLFHENVNNRLRKPKFTYDDLNEKYKNANTPKILYNFFHYFEDKHKSVNMISNDMYVQRLSNNLKKWYSDNLHHFD